MSNSVIFLLLGISFFALEALLAVDGYFLWLGLAGLVTSLLSYFLPEISFTASSVIFCGLSLLSIAAYRTWKHYRPDIPEIENLNTMSARYIGKIYDIVEVFDDNSAKIRIADALWRVRSESPELLAVGNKVRVIDQISSSELKVTSADAPYEINHVQDSPDAIHYQFSKLLTSRSARKHPELLQLFTQVHDLYSRKPDFKFERSAFYQSYLPQSIEVFQKLDAGVKLDKDEKLHLKNTVAQLSQRFRDIIDIHNNNKKDQLLARIDVLNVISKN